MTRDISVIFTGKDNLTPVARRAAGALTDMQGAVGKLQTAFGALTGGAVAVVLRDFITHSIEAQAQIANLSERLGVSVQEMSALRFMADQSDTSLEALATGMKKLSVNAVAAASGSAEMAAAFASIGVPVKNADGSLRAIDDILGDVAEEFRLMPEGVEKTALAVKLFGKTGDELIPFLNAGRAGIKEMREEAEKLGIVLDERAARAAKKFEDDTKKIKSAVDGTGTAITQALLPALGRSANNFIEAAKAAGSFASGLALLARIPSFDFDNLAEPIARLRKELDRPELLSGSRLKQAKEELEFFLALQRQQALALAEGVQSNEGQLASRNAAEQRFSAAFRQVKTQETEHLKLMLASQVKAYEEATKAVQAAQANRLKVEQEFAKLLTSVSTPGRAPGAPISLTEVSAAAGRAEALTQQAAGLKGEDAKRKAEEAIAAAREAGKLLEDLRAQEQKKLAETGARDLNEGDFAVIARRLQATATAAAGVEEAAAAERQAAIERIFNETLARAKALEALKIGFDEAGAIESAEKIRALIQQRLEANPIQVPMVAVPGGGNNLDTGAIDKLLQNLPAKAAGGPIIGPGGPRDDRVLMWGSNGEFVMPEHAVRHYGVGMMEALRRLALPKFADGGLIGNARLPTTASSLSENANFGTPVMLDFSAIGLGRVEMRGRGDDTAALVRAFQREALRAGSRR